MRHVVLLAWLTLGAVAIAAEPSVRPGANARYLAPDVDVAAWVGRFENDSREVYARRNDILRALALAPGMTVADVGAGTGLFVPLLAAAVGAEGRVYAVDIAPAFAAHLRDRAAEAGLAQVTVVLGHERSATLPRASIDMAFLCDAYHHFEYPQSVLASIRQALRPSGVLVVVDFERIPGASPAWILSHVRAGRAAVVAEIEAAGFALEGTPAPPGLKENFMLRFVAR